MSDYELPELPSDEELGITDDDRERYGELPEDRPELSEEEMVALLGQTRSPKPGGGSGDAPEGPGRPVTKKRKAPATGAAAAEAAPSRWRGPVTLVLLVAVAGLSSTRMAVPRPVPANVSDTVFSSARAMSMLVEIAERPHPTGSPEHARVRAYLVEHLRLLGLEPEIQSTTSATQTPDSVDAAAVRNVVARLPGTEPTGTVLITAHYDTRELAPGAGDDGAGVVAILEALRALRSGERLRNDVIVLLTDAEELGLLGALAFTTQHPWMRDVSLVLSFEMRGAGGPSIMFETGDRMGWVVRALKEFDPEPFANSSSSEIYRRMPNDTDFTLFREAGKQGLNFAAIGGAHVYHQATDTPENLSEATLQHHGVRALAALKHFGQADLGQVDAPDVVYFTAPLLGLVVYDARWVLPISGGLLALAVLVTLVALRGGARGGGAGAGLGLSLLGAALSFGAATAIARWSARFHPEGGSLAGSLYHSEGWYVLAVVAAVFAVVTALQAVARRWLSAVELSLGAACAPLLIAVGLSVAAPLAAMNVQWPAAAALLATLVLVLLRSRVGGTVAWFTTMLLTLPVLVILVPLLELLWISKTVAALGLVAVLTAMTLHLLLPALDVLRQPNGWWAPLTGLVVAAAGLGAGYRSSSPDERRPAPSTLVYGYEHGSGAAFWATDPAADPVLDEEAAAWAVERAGAAFSASRDLSGFGFGWEAPVAPAPVVSAATPEIAVLRDTIEAERRHVILGIRSRIGAERLSFQRDSVGR
ncbi:MAG TPA: M28 family peptidase, partial [Longimicrobiales bacterium]|nr:M28 family peptidase [Longimicrobiales bacterium]